MPQIRVFVVDDSVVFRKVLLEAINSIPGVRTVGVAANGRELLDALPTVKPDLITLDLKMPVMDGLETLRCLRSTYPEFRAVMVSAHTVEGAHATLAALEAGALDFITKPDTGDSSRNAELLREQVATLISKYVTSRTHLEPSDEDRHPQTTSVGGEKSSRHPFNPCSITPEVVALGISTGGPNALMQVLPAIPADFPLPVLIVQHMPALFTKPFAESLQRRSKIRIVEAQDGQHVQASTVYIAPGGSQMKVQRSASGEVVVRITDEPPENHCKPSVDYLFRSVAQAYGEKALGVIMTGMGSDGVLGLKLMKRRGAYVIAQDRASSIVWGMPHMAIDAGVVDIVLSLDAISTELIRLAGGPK